MPPARSHLVFDKYLDTIYPIVPDSEMNLAYSSNLLRFVNEIYTFLVFTQTEGELCGIHQICSDSEMKFAYFWFLTRTESELLDLPAGRPVKVGHQGILSIHFLRVWTNTKNTLKQIQK